MNSRKAVHEKHVFNEHPSDKDLRRAKYSKKKEMEHRHFSKSVRRN